MKYISTYHKQDAKTVRKILKEWYGFYKCYYKFKKCHEYDIYEYKVNENKTAYLIVKDKTFEGYIEAIRKFVNYSLKSGVKHNSFALDIHACIWGQSKGFKEITREDVIRGILAIKVGFY